MKEYNHKLDPSTPWHDFLSYCECCRSLGATPSLSRFVRYNNFYKKHFNEDGGKKKRTPKPKATTPKPKPTTRKPRTTTKPKVKTPPKSKSTTTKKPTKRATSKPKAPAKPKTPTKPKTTRKPKAPTKPKAPAKPKSEKIDKKQELIDSGFVGREDSTFHETFPIKFVHKQKGLKDMKVCYFQCEEHMKKYIKRYGLRKNVYIISKTPKDWR